jgi:hypothetical protein
MNISRPHLLFPLAVLIFAAGCKDSGTEPQPDPVTPPPPSGVVRFSADVLPILTNAGCTGCHGGTSGLRVGTVAQLLTGGNHGPAIVPGNADSSHLVQKLLSPPPFGSQMPFGGAPLAGASITVIRTWINQGALNN